MIFARMNRWAMAVLAATLLLPGCGARSQSSPAAGLQVVAEFYPLYVALLNLTEGVPGVQVANLVPTATGCPEDYALSPGDLQTLAQADIFVVNGAGLENYLGKVATQFPHLKVADASVGLDLLKTNGEINPHLWVSPAQAARQVRTMAAALAQADATHAALYRKNGEAYAARLEALAGQLQAGLAGASVRQVVAFHDSLPYLARDLNLETLAVIEPAPGQNPNARELAEIVAKVHASSQPVALLTELDSKNPAAEVLGRELGQPLYALDTVTAGPLDPAAAKNAYFTAMNKNLLILQAALGVKDHGTHSAQ